MLFMQMKVKLQNEEMNEGTVEPCVKVKSCSVFTRVKGCSCQFDTYYFLSGTVMVSVSSFLSSCLLSRTCLRSLTVSLSMATVTSLFCPNGSSFQVVYFIFLSFPRKVLDSIFRELPYPRQL